jgi:flagellar motor protein MotB
MTGITACRVLRLCEVQTKFQIPTNRIDVRGFGCTRLQFPDDTDEHREKNRRVEIVFRKEGGE